MKKLVLSFSMLLLVFFANAQQNKQEVIAKLKALEVLWNNSPLEKDHGAKAYGEILADDFYATCSDGIARNKAEIIKFDTESKDVVASVKLGQMKVNFYGDNLASVTGSHVVKGKTQEGKEFTKNYAWTDVYMERKGKWQCIASGTTVVKK